METIIDLLNRIRWDKKENPYDYTIYYEDRVTENNVRLEFKEILRVEGNFFVIASDSGETFIPLHRIREVRNQGISVWKRMLDK
ncbi:MAG: DUF504 domain-containing protein [Nanoarchaeota archaeon]|nr:DUF504 domain-containing protein [Nanoarchaeota archaeon]